MSCAAVPVSNAWALTLQYRPFAYSMARQFARRNRMLHRLEDLRQEALLGLHHAAVLFNPARGVAFSTFSTRWVLAALRNAAELHSGDPVKVSRRAYSEGERAWSVSLEAPARGDDDDGRALVNTLPSPDRWAANAEARVDAGRLLARASARSFRPQHNRRGVSPLRDVEAFFRTAQGESGQEIGDETHVSRERVRQLAERGGTLLRRAAGLSMAGE